MADDEYTPANVLATAVAVLKYDNEHAAAEVLQQSILYLEGVDDPPILADDLRRRVHLRLVCPVSAYATLRSTEDPTRRAITNALTTVFAPRFVVAGLAISPAPGSANPPRTVLGTPGTLSQDSIENLHPPTPMPDSRTVFVVYGRNNAVRSAFFAFLRALDLRPLEWPQAIELTKQASPYVGTVLEAGFREAQAVVVLLTPDDEVRLASEYCGDDEPADEREFRRQPRPNVLFEAGMALAMHSDRTLLIQIGDVKIPVTSTADTLCGSLTRLRGGRMSPTGCAPLTVM